MMIKRISVAVVASSALLVASAAGATSTATVTISHQMRGCHSWQLDNGPIRASLSITLRAGTLLKFVNNDVMPHKLIQTAGPKLTLVRPSLNKVGASTSVKLTKKGVYRFTTKAGEDYKWAAGMKTTGEDHVLHLKVQVR
jgi:plastocyanin